MVDAGAAPSAAPHRADEGYALSLDAADPLAPYRERFHIPRRPGGQPVIYFCGNSLGLQPKAARECVDEELRAWAELAVEGHFHGRHPWYPYHENFRASGARLVGALPDEVVYMNGLTVNLHLMMVTFYRPTRERYRILIEESAFPSDIYAARTQLHVHGIDPADGLVVARPRAGEHTLRMDDLEELIAREGERLALALLPGVNYFTGQRFDIPRLTRAVQRVGAVAGFDLAHAAGNVPLRLHDWNVDFAAWCTYKYLNCGPGAVAGCFIHERHATNVNLPRFGGWWGNDPATRFRMHLEPEFRPVPSADAWQLSNPPIFAMAPMRAALDMFDQVGMAALRAKAERMIEYLQFLLDELVAAGGRFELITPRPLGERGCQFSILTHDRPRALFKKLEADGVVCDFREPNVIRVAPTPLYNTFHEIWRFAQVLKRHV